MGSDRGVSWSSVLVHSDQWKTVHVLIGRSSWKELVTYHHYILCKMFLHSPFFTFHVFTDQQNETINVLVVSSQDSTSKDTHTHVRTHTHAHTHAHTHIPSVSCLLVCVCVCVLILIHHLLSCIMFPGSSHLYNCINL